jgi:predicted aconitase with swiveling domain
VLGIPFTIGSSTTAAVFLQSIRDKTSPAAIITIGADDFLALASIVAEEMYDSPIPIISVKESDYKKLITGTHVQISQSGEIRIR